MSTQYFTLRRSLAQRMNLWGGALGGNGSATTTASSAANTLIDTTRPEPDDEWDESWVVLNPGSADQVNKPTIWRRVAATSGWVQSTGTLTIQGTWPTPYTTGVASGVSYELYKVYRPENWLQAVNYSLTNAYPQRHRPVNFEVPQDYNSRILDWMAFAKATNSLTDPTGTLTVTEVANGQGDFMPGVYTLAYTLFNDFGETLQSPTTTVTIANNSSQIDIAAITGLPASAQGVRYYCSMIPNDATLDLLSVGSAIMQNVPTYNTPPGQSWAPGWAINGQVVEIHIPSPNPYMGSTPPSYNTTAIDVMEMRQVQKRINPGSYPEIWNDMGMDMFKPLGGSQLQLMYFPNYQYNLKFLCTAPLAELAGETDGTSESKEMILWGAESYLWGLLTKTSTIVNVNWKDLYNIATANYEKLKGQFAFKRPSDQIIRPVIQTEYALIPWIAPFIINLLGNLHHGLRLFGL